MVRAECLLLAHGMHRPRPARLKNFLYVGKYHYSLCFVTKARTRAFDSGELASAAIGQILKTCELEKFVVLAYCVMIMSTWSSEARATDPISADA